MKKWTPRTCSQRTFTISPWISPTPGSRQRADLICCCLLPAYQMSHCQIMRSVLYSLFNQTFNFIPSIVYLKNKDGEVWMGLLDIRLAEWWRCCHRAATAVGLTFWHKRARSKIDSVPPTKCSCLSPRGTYGAGINMEMRCQDFRMLQDDRVIEGRWRGMHQLDHCVIENLPEKERSKLQGKT